MQHTTIKQLKDDAFNLVYLIGASEITYELHKIFQCVAYSENRLWVEEEIFSNRNILDAVTLFLHSLNDALSKHKKEWIELSSSEHVDSEKIFDIGTKLFTSYNANDINSFLWECYFESMTCEKSKFWKRIEFANIGFTLRLVTQLISDFDRLIISDEQNRNSICLN